MKKLIITVGVALLSLNSVNSQTKKPSINNSSLGTVSQLNQGISIPNLKNLSTKELSKLNIPIVSLTDAQKNAKSITSWKLDPLRPRDNWLSVSGFYGLISQRRWGIESSPFFEGTKIAKWEPGWLILRFKQSKEVEYRLKIKIQGNNHRGKAIHVQLDDMSGRYPINPDGTVHVVWTASSSTDNSKIRIGHLLPNSYHFSDYPLGFPRTMVEAVSIDQIR